MLVLTRRPGETVIITMPDGTEIKIVLLGVKGTQARYGIDAPRDVAVDREEIWVRKKVHP